MNHKSLNFQCSAFIFCTEKLDLLRLPRFGFKFEEAVHQIDGEEMIMAIPEEFKEDFLRRISTGASISASGKVVESQGAGQSVELVAENLD